MDNLPPRIGEAVSSQSDPSPAINVASAEPQSLPHIALDGELTDSASSGHPSAPPAQTSAGTVSSEATNRAPQHFPALAELAQNDTVSYVHKTMFDVLRGAAWSKGEDGREVRWGLVDQAGKQYGPRARGILEGFLSDTLKMVGYPEIHVAVSTYPGNRLRVVIHKGEPEFFDCTFAYSKAEIV